MDCTSNNSPRFDHEHEDDHINISKNNNNVNVDVDASFYEGGVSKDDADVVDVEQINTATTSASSSNPRGQEEQEQVQLDKNNSNNEDEDHDKDTIETILQPSSPPPPSLMITTMIVKGKRTKRQRLHSPTIPSAIPIGDINNNNMEDDDVDDLVVVDESEKEEDEEQLDMANCLILLAQGPSRPYSSPPLIRRNELGLFTKLASRGGGGGHKRSYSSGVAGIYECKTCSRTFPSFQALGGHRASHKKLKITAEANEFKHFSINNPEENNNSSPSQLVTIASSSSPLLLQLGNINYARAPPPTPTHTAVVGVHSHNNKTSSRKVHECSICGAEFSSGQALGGHMRRHRGPVTLNSSTTTTTTTTTTTNNNPIANTTLSLSTNPIAVESATAKANRINTGNNGFLSLDLNLPASPSPEDDDQTKFSLAHKQPQSQQQQQQQPQQQSAMVFSTPALVDCFY